MDLETPIEAGKQAEAASDPTQAANFQFGEISVVEEKLDQESTLCPQGDDCAGERAPTQLLDCELGCGFRGCAACLKLHDDAPHASDSDTMLAMVREIGGTK